MPGDELDRKRRLEMCLTRRTVILGKEGDVKSDGDRLIETFTLDSLIGGVVRIRLFLLMHHHSTF